jgi:hypothetical protein
MRIEVLADLHGPYWHPQDGIDAVISLGDMPNEVLEKARGHVSLSRFCSEGES